MAIYILSDTHFGHKRVLEFERFDFKTIEEHDEYIIEKWNSTVKENDKVYHLGDVIFKYSKYTLKELTSKLKGYKILIRGNHDKRSNDYYLNNGFNEVYNHPIYLRENIILSHQPVMEVYNNPYIINIHGHLHGATLSLDNFICVAMDQIGYIPQRIDELIKTDIKIKKRKNKFLKEWYAKYYKFYIDKHIILDNEGDVDVSKTNSVFFKSIMLNYKELELLNEICSFSSRILLGQFSHFTYWWKFFDLNYKEIIEEKLLEIKIRYDGFNLNGNYGIYNEKVSQLCKVLYDAHQKIRYQLYLLDKERYKMTYYSNSFLKSSNYNEIYVEKQNDRFRLSIPIEILKKIITGIDIYLASLMWEEKTLAKYIQMNSILKMDYKYIVIRLKQIKEYFTFNDKAYLDEVVALENKLYKKID